MSKNKWLSLLLCSKIDHAAVQMFLLMLFLEMEFRINVWNKIYVSPFKNCDQLFVIIQKNTNLMRLSVTKASLKPSLCNSFTRQKCEFWCLIRFVGALSCALNQFSLSLCYFWLLFYIYHSDTCQQCALLQRFKLAFSID